jgi:energy-coupling factor transporter transmembrane protein EcfT|tara:strand:+ start:11393 stop:12082 length:690 start_codon:yes stop_codon:yes gene_type:complete
MTLEQIITIVIVALIVVFAWAIFKKVFKLLFYVGIIIFLLIAANTYFIYEDVMDLKENFAILEKKVLLVDDKEVVAGLLLNEETNFLTNEQLEDYSSYLRNEDYEKILGDSYKLMIFDLDIILNLDEIEIWDEIVTNDYVISALKSDVDSMEKASLFGVVLANNILSSKNPLFFFSEFKKGNIMVYPETALFKTVKIIPLPFIKDIGKKILYKTKEKVESFVVYESENI